MDKHTAAAAASEHTQILADVTQHTIWLMGASFILGSLVTVLMLLALDFIRRNKTN